MPGRRLVVAAAAASLALPLMAHAAWPDKLIRIVVTFACGGASDIVADPVIVKTFEELGITTVTMGGAEFTRFVARQVADGGPAINGADIEP